MIADRLNSLLTEAGQPELPRSLAPQFESYLELLLRWNARTNLTAIRDEDGILRRHFLESIAFAQAVPGAVKTLLDFGSGAGFPGIPAAICLPHVAVTLAESQGKKAAFLREAVRTLNLSTRVHGGRAEMLDQTFDCVTLRAVDKMGEAVKAAAGLVGAAGWLAPMTTGSEVKAIQGIAGQGFEWGAQIALPGGNDRILLLGQKKKR